MKYIILLGDGMGDHPIKELGGKTPLAAAKIPNMNYLAQNGELGLIKTAPDGFKPGSDVTQMVILGYDPRKYYTGRSPLEAASMDVQLGKDDVAFRCNLVTLKHPTTGYDIRKINSKVVMADYSAGHITSEEAKDLIYELNTQLGTEEIQFYPGVSYRHLMVWVNGKTQLKLTAPHDISDKPVMAHLPSGDNAEIIKELMQVAMDLLRQHPVNEERLAQGKPPANSIWLWGHGKAPALPKFSDRFHVTGAMISAVDLLKGLGKYAGFEILNVPGATGYLDTNYQGKAEYALKALESKDLIYLHVEAPDEASHMGDLAAKIKALEDFDRLTIGTLLKGLDKFGEYRILLIPDHYNPVAMKTHTSEPVPYAIYEKSKTNKIKKSGQAYNEAAAQSTGIYYEEGTQLIERFMKV